MVRQYCNDVIQFGRFAAASGELLSTGYSAQVSDD